MKKAMTDQDRKYIKDNAGKLSLRQIANKTGIRYSSVYIFARRNNLPIYPIGHPKASEIAENIGAKYNYNECKLWWSRINIK